MGKSMHKDLQQYIFYKKALVRYYDPIGVITNFYIAFPKPIAFKHISLGNVEKYKNLRDESKIKEIDALLSKNKVFVVPAQHTPYSFLRQ